MPLTMPRGPLSRLLIDVLCDEEEVSDLVALTRALATDEREVLVDDDLQLTLYLMYELHFGGLPLIDDRWEWDPDLLRARSQLEARLEAALRRFCPPPPSCLPTQVPGALFALAAAEGGAPSLPAFVARAATLDQVRELMIMRSPYQLKEGDPQSFAIPRLRGRAKAALIEIQSDEYGGGRLDRMHSTLFADSLRALGLDQTPGAHLDQVPAIALASHNALSLFGLHRRWRGALCGHLAAFEMTSSLPAQRWVRGLQRLGLPTAATAFFDEHVEADAVHEQIAAHDLCGSLVHDEPELVDDVLFGAATCLALDAAVAAHALDAWATARSALRATAADTGICA